VTLPVVIDTPQGPYEFDTQEQADRYLAASQQARKPVTAPPAPAPSESSDYGYAAKRGLVRGLMNNADLAIESSKGPTGTLMMGGVPWIIRQLMERKEGKPFEPSQRVLESLDMKDKSSGAGARYLEEGVAGGVGALATGGKVAPSVVSGVAGGLGGEASADMFGDNPVSRVAGSLISSLLGYGGYSAVAGSRAKTRVHDIAKDIPDKTFDEIKEALDNAKKQGVKISAAQATSERTPLSALSQEVTSSPATAPKAGLNLEAQAGQAKSAADRLLGMMGGVKDPTEAAHGAQKAATKAIAAADSDLSNTVKPLYETDLNKLADFAKRKNGLAKAIFAESDPATEHGKHLKDLAKAVTKAETPEQLNAIYNEWNQGLQQNKLNGKSVVDFAAGEIRNKGLSKLDRFLNAVQVNRKGAQDEFAYQTSRVIDPLRRSPVGQLAGRAGIQEDVPTQTARILRVLDDHNVRAQSILDTQVTLDKQAPGTFAKLAAAAFDKKVQEAFKGREGQTPFDAPAQLAQAVWGGPKQTAMRENFRATMAGVARSHGLTGAAEGEFVKGAEKIMQAIEAAGREKVTGNISHPSPVVGEIAKGAGAVALYAPQATGVISRTLEKVSGGKLAKDLYEMLWSGPEGVDKIRKYARMSIPEIRASALAGAGAAAYEQAKE
jgi:hypothetical protein